MPSFNYLVARAYDRRGSIDKKKGEKEGGRHLDLAYRTSFLMQYLSINLHWRHYRRVDTLVVKGLRDLGATSLETRETSAWEGKFPVWLLVASA